MESTAIQNQELPGWIRWLTTFLGGCLMIGASGILYCPPTKFSKEFDKGVVVKIILESSDITTPFLSIFLAGLALAVFGINGMRFAKITAAGVTAETSNPTTAASNFYKAPSEERPESEVTIDAKTSPEPNELPAGSLESNDGGKYAVYSLNQVPSSVIQDAFQNWPGEDRQPEDLSGFEFATRKTGRGNHPWTIKFKGRKAVTVKYGGHGKTSATVVHGE